MPKTGRKGGKKSGIEIWVSAFNVDGTCNYVTRKFITAENGRLAAMMARETLKRCVKAATSKSTR